MSRSNGKVFRRLFVLVLLTVCLGFFSTRGSVRTSHPQCSGTVCDGKCYSSGAHCCGGYACAQENCCVGGGVCCPSEKPHYCASTNLCYKYVTDAPANCKVQVCYGG